jgi:hypothetical protein
MGETTFICQYRGKRSLFISEINSSMPKEATKGQECSPNNGHIPKCRERNEIMIIFRQGTSPNILLN